MTPMLRRRRSFPWVGCGLVLLLAVLPLGCSRRGTVSGQVLFNGKPLPGGTVKFNPVDTRYNPATATIDESGNYQVTVPVGEARISVDNRALKHEDAGPIGIAPPPTEKEGKAARRGPGGPPGSRGEGPPPGVTVTPPRNMMQEKMKERGIPATTGTKPAGTYMAIPDKYYSPETSGLQFTVQGGAQTFNIELTK